MKPIRVFAPADLRVSERQAPLDEYNIHFLAQGDSWFSFGAFPPTLTTNLFDGMGTTNVAACVVNCAHPGDKLSLMVNRTRATDFLALLNGKQVRRWRGLLISGGGNDLIAAIKQSPSNEPHQRLLRTRAEWGLGADASKYLSEDGWQTFANHMTSVFAQLLTARDKAQENRGIPVVCHNYDFAVPRNSGAGLKFGPWLHPTMESYGIPLADRPALGRLLMAKLRDLIDEIARNTPDRSIHVVQTQGTLNPAGPDQRGATEHWENEIHPSSLGYRMLSAKWLPVLDSVFNA